MVKISLQPIGKISPQLLVELKRGLEEVFPLKVEIISQNIPIPFSALDKRRGQYRAPDILSLLKSPKGVVSLGVIDVDLYSPWLNFVFGQASPRWGAAIISLTRLRQEFYGLQADEGLFKLRVLKEAVHEIGHLFDLGHCPNSSCVMFFSNSLADTDRNGWGFCHSCKRRLEKWLNSLTQSRLF